MKLQLLAFTAATLISGCAIQPPQVVEIQSSFDASAASTQMAPGANTIKGNAFLRQRGGGVVTCAGATVFLFPTTKYAEERIQAIYGNTVKGVSTRSVTFNPDSPEYHKTMRTTQCDSQGNFVFDKVSDGSFFVTTSVRWEVANTPQGGVLMQKIGISGGQTQSVVLSQ